MRPGPAERSGAGAATAASARPAPRRPLSVRRTPEPVGPERDPQPKPDPVPPQTVEQPAPTEVSEPGSLWLFGLALAAMGVLRRRRGT